MRGQRTKRAELLTPRPKLARDLRLVGLVGLGWCPRELPPCHTRQVSDGERGLLEYRLPKFQAAKEGSHGVLRDTRENHSSWSNRLPLLDSCIGVEMRPPPHDDDSGSPNRSLRDELGSSCRTTHSILITGLCPSLGPKLPPAIRTKLNWAISLWPAFLVHACMKPDCVQVA